MRPIRPKTSELEPSAPDNPADQEVGEDAALGGAVDDSDEEPELDFDTEN
jgi:hypothetical protein